MDEKFRKSLSSRYQRFVKRGVAGITASSRVLPDFIIAGTVRSGTTSLYYNICEHPSVLSADYDEIGYFDSNYHLGINWYRSMFPTHKHMNEVKEKTGNSITGEDTPFYFWKKEAAERILKDLPNTKIIMIFRNPVDRAYSNYNLGVRYKTEELSFDNAIDKEIEFLDEHSFRETVDSRRSYVSKGIYENQIRLWFNVFPRKQIHILSTEDMSNNPREELKEIFRFLDIDEYDIKQPQKQKVAKYKQMKKETRKKLLDFYKPHNERFFEMIQHEFEWNI